MARKPLMAGNWKMNKTIPEAVAMVKELKGKIADVKDVDVLICPTFTAIAALANEAKGSNINIGAQDIFWEAKGAFTGEIAPNMLVDAGCTYVIIGHSERRQYFGETNETVNKKVKAALANGLIPVVCVGETLKEREDDVTFKVIESQIREGLKDLSKEDAAKIVIAYEPVWAIGTGKTATPDQAQEVHAFARKVYGEMYGDACQQVRILYGGSVKPDNVKELMKKEDIDGGLVGGASLKADSFEALVKFNN
ncbi:triose-phosphate isomerase [Candidatus Ruminimicrobium bovinum]|uniref:triose-phosphate isomerase n=1 Tax=Candidatus Ruminimicrobium bovinum TaxID=3242779 RepID=UPI0039B921D0